MHDSARQSKVVLMTLNDYSTSHNVFHATSTHYSSLELIGVSIDNTIEDTETPVLANQASSKD